MSAQGGAKGQTSRDFADVPHDSVDSYAPPPPEQQINKNNLNKLKIKKLLFFLLSLSIQLLLLIIIRINYIIKLNHPSLPLASSHRASNVNNIQRL